jgi:hypothetical protein
LQSPALPLGYPAIRRVAEVKADYDRGKSLETEFFERQEGEWMMEW